MFIDGQTIAFFSLLIIKNLKRNNRRLIRYSQKLPIIIKCLIYGSGIDIFFLLSLPYQYLCSKREDEVRNK